MPHTKEINAILEENPALGAIFERRSCRSFRSDPIPKEHIDLFIEVLRWAPSAGNRQPWRFHIVTKKKKKQELAEAAFGQNFITPAPIVFGVVAVPEESAARYGERGERLYCIQDTAAAVENLLLAATALGYGSCWIGAFDDDAVSRTLGLPPGHIPVALVPLGRPARFGQRTGRRPASETVLKSG
jgi:nitroreductase